MPTSIATINGGDLPSNSRTDINNNFASLNTNKIETSFLDTDTSLTANSDTKIPSQKAVKAYVDSGGNPNASEIQAGRVEIATDAEVTSGASTGGTGAPVVITPAKLQPAVGIFTPNAGETINGATLPVPVYQNKTDNEVYACDANDATKYKFLGFAISNSTNGNAITVKTSGIVSGFTGLTEGEKYYVSDTVGTIANTVGTMEILVGIAISETQLLIQKGKFRASGVTSFTSTTTTTITTGFRVSSVRIFANGQDSGQISISSGGWSVAGGNNCLHTYTSAGTASNGSTQSYAWFTYLNGANNHNGIIDTITDTTFRLNNTEASGSSTVTIYWEAEGEL